MLHVQGLNCFTTDYGTVSAGAIPVKGSLIDRRHLPLDLARMSCWATSARFPIAAEIHQTFTAETLRNSIYRQLFLV